MGSGSSHLEYWLAPAGHGSSAKRSWSSSRVSPTERRPRGSGIILPDAPGTAIPSQPNRQGKEPAPERSPPLPLFRRDSEPRASDGAPPDWLQRPGEMGGERGSSAKPTGLSREWRWRARCFFSPRGWVGSKFSEGERGLPAFCSAFDLL